jgi:hypothetical protein
MVKSSPSVTRWSGDVQIDQNKFEKICEALGHELHDDCRKDIESAATQCLRMHRGHQAAPDAGPVRDRLEKIRNHAVALQSILEPVISSARSDKPGSVEFAVYSKLLSQGKGEISKFESQLTGFVEASKQAFDKTEIPGPGGAMDPSFPMLIRRLEKIALEAGETEFTTYNPEKNEYTAPFFWFVRQVMMALPEDMHCSSDALGKRIQRALSASRSSAKDKNTPTF